MDGNFCSRVSGHIGMVSLSNSLRPHHHLLYLLGLGSVEDGWELFF